MAAPGSPRESLFTAGPDLTDLVIRMDGVSVRRGDSTLLHDVDWAVEHQIGVIGTPADAIARIERLYGGDRSSCMRNVIPHFAASNSSGTRPTTG